MVCIISNTRRWRLSTIIRDRRGAVHHEISARIRSGINPRLGAREFYLRHAGKIEESGRSGLRRIMDDQRKPIAEPFEIN